MKWDDLPETGLVLPVPVGAKVLTDTHVKRIDVSMHDPTVVEAEWHGSRAIRPGDRLWVDTAHMKAECTVTDMRIDWDSLHVPTTTIRLVETDMRF